MWCGVGCRVWVMGWFRVGVEGTPAEDAARARCSRLSHCSLSFLLSASLVSAAAPAIFSNAAARWQRDLRLSIRPSVAIWSLGFRV